MAFVSTGTPGRHDSKGASTSGIEAPSHEHVRSWKVSSFLGEMRHRNGRRSLLVLQDRSLLTSRQASLHRPTKSTCCAGAWIFTPRKTNASTRLNAEQCLTRTYKWFAFIHSSVDYAQMHSIIIAIIVDTQCVGRCWTDSK